MNGKSRQKCRLFPYLTDFEADFDAEWLATAEQVC